MILQGFPSGPFETIAYIVGCPISRKAAIIDPAPGSAASLLAYLKEENLQAEKILLTHSHWDHIADAAELVEALHLPLHVHAADAGNIEKPGSDRLRPFLPIKGVVPSGYLTEGQIIPVGHLQFEVIHTPGHTPGGVCFYEPQEKVLLSGDTLFKGTIGNLSFPTSSERDIWPSLDKLARLPGDVKVYPGHGPSTTIGDESWLPNARRHFGYRS